jgi:hypothetical protein
MATGNTFKWTPECQQEFQVLKNILSTPPVLRHFPDPEREFLLFTDASDYALGCVLAQLNEQGTEQVIAYHSRVLSAEERNYAVFEREALGILEGVTKFRIYLLAKPFTVYTDHNSLKTLLTWKNPTGRICRWLTTLQQYAFQAVYRSGAKHLNADAMSRMFSPAIPEGYDQGRLIFQDGILKCEGMFEEDFAALVAKPQRMKKVISVAETNPTASSSNSSAEPLNRPPSQEELDGEAQDLYVALRPLMGQVFRIPQEEDVYRVDNVFLDEAAGRVKAICSNLSRTPTTTLILEEAVVRQCIRNHGARHITEVGEAIHYAFDQNFAEAVRVEIPTLIQAGKLKFEQIIYRETRTGVPLAYRNYWDSTQAVYIAQLIIPSVDQVLINYLIRIAHEHTLTHLMAAKTFDFLQQRVYFRGMRKLVEEYVGGCEQCQQRGYQADKNLNSYMIRSLPLVYAPMQRVSVDIMGPLPRSDEGFTHLILAVDAFSKFVIGKAIRTASALEVAKFLVQRVYLQHGCPTVTLNSIIN